VTEAITARRGRAPATREYVARRVQLDYAAYARHRKKLRLE
jgi:hypothetical protein